MALIICRECGKRISDTADKCIHCGAPIELSVAEITQEAYDEKNTENTSGANEVRVAEPTADGREDNTELESMQNENANENANGNAGVGETETGPRLISENDLSEEEWKEIYKKFYKNDKWAKRYRRFTRERWKFVTPILWCPALLYVLVRLLILNNGSEISNDSRMLGIIMLVSLIGLAALLVGMILYAVIASVYYRIIYADLIHFKKFRLWLLKERNVEMTGVFGTEKIKTIYDNIDVERWK